MSAFEWFSDSQKRICQPGCYRFLHSMRVPSACTAYTFCAVQRNRRGHIKCQEVGEVEQFAAWRLAYLKGYGLIAVSDADTVARARIAHLLRDFRPFAFKLRVISYIAHLIAFDAHIAVLAVFQVIESMFGRGELLHVLLGRFNHGFSHHVVPRAVLLDGSIYRLEEAPHLEKKSVRFSFAA